MHKIDEFAPTKQFIETVGEDVQEYFGETPACIIYLRPDGVFYGEALYKWLKKKKKDVSICTMDDDGEGLHDRCVRGRKVLIVDNDVVTGKGYKRSTEALRMRRKELDIKGIKFATFFDRVGVSDFYVEKYSSEAIWHLDELDALDLKIIKLLSQNGRGSLAEIGKKIKLSSVSVKNRVDKLVKAKILRVQGALNIDQFYTMSAQIQIEADTKTIVQLEENLAKLQEVYHMVRVSGRYNLVIGMLAHHLENIEEFIENEVRSLPGVRQIEIHIGELPFTPKLFTPQL